MELTLVGLQYSGKTTFVNVIAVSQQRYFALSILPQDEMNENIQFATDTYYKFKMINSINESFQYSLKSF